MTLKRLRPATINSTKLFAFVLIAFGIAAFAYRGADYMIVGKVIGSAPRWLRPQSGKGIGIN